MKPQPIILREKTIYGRRLLVWRNVRMNEPIADNLWATIFPAGWDWDESGTSAELYDWKVDKAAGTIYVRGRLYRGNGSYQGLDGVFPCEVEAEPLKSPGRNYVWNEHGGLGRQWRNSKTGERRGAF